ncbi:hypothetical protein COCON_G00158070 [Conger conger]|uniref:Uncharacterized protein n=1 Tax=Conger conger TaxID=82655 RepID=A0A9Q1HV17_CONCO|nr:hypothetical protein COCON_G00158070 [Conger conger]
MRYGPFSVGGCPSEILDETHCFWVMCPHPGCWEAAQRVARGVARRRQSRTPVRSKALLQEEFPTLNIVNVSEWAKTRKPPKKKMLSRAFNSENCHSVTSQSQLCSQSQNFLKDSNVRLESLKDLHFPDLTSAAKIPHSTTYKCNKDVTLSLAQISPLEGSSGALCGSVSMVVWIPNPNRISRGPSHSRRKSPNIAVRDLACVPSSHSYDVPKPNRKKSINVKKTEHLQLTSANGRPPASGHMVSQIALDTSDTDLAEPAVTAEPVLAPGGIRGVLQPEPASEAPPGPHPSPASREPSACLRNKPAAVHSDRERGPRREPGPHALTHRAQYRLDSANGAEGIDWLRLRSQAYLWKKHNQRQSCDKDKSALAPPKPHHLSKATLHHHHRGSLEIGPAVCGCVECVEETWGCGAGGFPTLSQSSELMHHTALRQPLDTGHIGDRKLNGEHIVGSRHSALERMRFRATLQDSLGQERGSVGRASGRSLSRGREDLHGSVSDSEDEDFGPSESNLSAPPPSLRSDLAD